MINLYVNYENTIAISYVIYINIIVCKFIIFLYNESTYGGKYMSIVCVGQCAYDITFPIEEELKENQKYRIYHKFECIGAPAANASILCAMWGEDTTLISRIGTDVYGKEIKKTLESFRVSTKYIYEDRDFATPISAIIANASNGYRTIFNCPGIQKELPFQYPEENVEVILVDGHELQASLAMLERHPKAISIIDAGTYKDETSILAGKVDYLICSQDFAFQYTGVEINIENIETWERTFIKLRDLHKKQIVVTLGEKGLLYERNYQIVHMPAFSVTAIDSTGAGDIFHGAFAYCMKKGYALKDALKISSAASAISVQTLGGQPSIPSKTAVNEFLHISGESIILR